MQFLHLAQKTKKVQTRFIFFLLTVVWISICHAFMKSAYILLSVSACIETRDGTFDEIECLSQEYTQTLGYPVHKLALCLGGWPATQAHKHKLWTRHLRSCTHTGLVSKLRRPLCLLFFTHEQNCRLLWYINNDMTVQNMTELLGVNHFVPLFRTVIPAAGNGSTADGGGPRHPG